jgi:hypothetical protein
MRAFGYEKGKESESPLELKEATLSLTAQELDDVIAFLRDVKSKMAQCPEAGSFGHMHFRDWSRAWKEGDDSDFIIAGPVAAKRRRSRR